jgi:hypothetical protein
MTRENNEHIEPIDTPPTDVEETAEALRVSSDTVKRDWRLAKLWLLRELEGRHQ